MSVPHGSDVETAVAYLRSPLAIRARCENILEAALAGKLNHFKVEMDALPAVVDEVVAITRASYPNLAPPVHGRLNHFRAGGVDRVAALDAALSTLHRDDRARAWTDLVVVSVLLDAGAGDAWRFREPGTGLEIGRSEGLAVASLHAFQSGLFSSAPEDPLRVDAEALRSLDPDKLAAAFQVSDTNPMVGVDRQADVEGDGRAGFRLDVLGEVPNRPQALRLRIRFRDHRIGDKRAPERLLEGALDA